MWLFVCLPLLPPCLVLGSPKVDRAPLGPPGLSRAERSPPSTRWQSSAGANQETAGHLCQRTHCWLTSTLCPPGALAFFLLPISSVSRIFWCLDLLLPRWRTSYLLPWVNVMWLQVTVPPVCQDSLNGSTTLQSISHSTQLYIIYKASSRPK